MIAMILAAGMGTRLQPLTNNTPKALVLLNGKPLIYYVLTRLMASGIREVVVNVHHHADALRSYLSAGHFPGLVVRISDESELLLDTGGAIRKAAPLLRGYGNVLVQNVDVLCDINLQKLRQFHEQRASLVCLAVRKRKSGRYLLFRPDGQLCGWQNTSSGEYLWSNTACTDHTNLAFSGIHIFAEEVLDLLPEAERFPVLHHYVKLAAKHRVLAFHHEAGLWTDLGRPEDLIMMEEWFRTAEGSLWLNQYLDGWSPS